MMIALLITGLVILKVFFVIVEMYVRCLDCSNPGVVRHCNHDMKDCKREELRRSRQHPFEYLNSAVAKDVRPRSKLRNKQDKDSSHGCKDSLLPFVKGQEESVLSLPDKVLESVQTMDTAGVVEEFKRSLEIDEASLQQPDDETKRWVRCLCNKAPRDKRVALVQHLRQITPAGTTGPILPESLDVREIPVMKMRDLTINLCGGDEWKLLAERFGLTQPEIRYLDKRTMNPCDATLSFIANTYHVNVGDLYNFLVDCELPAMADLL